MIIVVDVIFRIYSFIKLRIWECGGSSFSYVLCSHHSMCNACWVEIKRRKHIYFDVNCESYLILGLARIFAIKHIQISCTTVKLTLYFVWTLWKDWRQCCTHPFVCMSKFDVYLVCLLRRKNYKFWRAFVGILYHIHSWERPSFTLKCQNIIYTEIYFKVTVVQAVQFFFRSFTTEISFVIQNGFHLLTFLTRILLFFLCLSLQFQSKNFLHWIHDVLDFLLFIRQFDESGFKFKFRLC